MGLSNELFCEAGSFSRGCLNPGRCFQSEVEALFPRAGTLDCVICLAPQLFLLVYLHANVGPPSPPATPCHESSVPSSPTLPLLPVWMNVSSLTPWLSNFHTVRFSVNSGCFLFLNLLLSTYASIVVRGLSTILKNDENIC